MPRRGDDGGFESTMRTWLRAQLGNCWKPQDADAAGDLVIHMQWLPLLVGEAKAYRDRGNSNKANNPTLRAIRDALNEAAAEATMVGGIPFGVVKRTGKADPAQQLVVMEAGAWVRHLQGVAEVLELLSRPATPPDETVAPPPLHDPWGAANEGTDR